MRFARILFVTLLVSTLGACGFGDNEPVVMPTVDEATRPTPSPSIAATADAATPILDVTGPVSLLAGPVSAAQGDAARTGRNPGPGLDGAPAVTWLLSLDAPVRAAPVLADGILVVVSEGDDGALVALDAASGRELWQRPGGSGASPAVASGLVYVGTSGAFDAYDLRTGDPVWSFKTQTTLWSSPIVAGDAVYVCDLDNRLLYALEAATGRQRWNLRNFNRPPAAAGDLVFAAGPDALFALNVGDGSVRWLEYMDAVGHPVAAAAGVYVVAQSLDIPIRYLLIALDDKGVERWRADLGAVAATAPAVSTDEQTIYVAASEPGRSTALIAVDAATGERRFAVDTGSVAVTAPVLAGDRVYLSSQDGTIAAYDAGSGARRWSFVPASGTLTAPVVAGELVFVGNAGPTAGRVVAIGGQPDGATPIAATPTGASTPRAGG